MCCPASFRASQSAACCPALTNTQSLYYYIFIMAVCWPASLRNHPPSVLTAYLLLCSMNSRLCSCALCIIGYMHYGMYYRLHIRQLIARAVAR